MSAEPDERFSEAFCAIVELHEALKLPSLNTLPGCWEYQVDEHWWIAVNAHGKDKPHSHGGFVAPIHALIEWHGWPAGLINPFAGTIAAHPDGANEDRFIADVRAAALRAREVTG